MTRRSFGGAIGADCTPDGEYVVSFRNRPLLTHVGEIVRPGEDLLFPRIKFGRVTGKGQSTDAALVFDGAWTAHGPAHGNNPCIFDLAGTLVVATPAIGSQGYRYVADDGRLVTGDETVNDQTDLARSFGLHRIWEWSRFDGITIGQGNGDRCVAILPSGKRVVLDDAPIVSGSGRVSHEGTRFAVASVRPDGTAVLLWFDASELDAFPLEPPFADPPPVPQPIPVPQPQPRPEPLPVPEPNAFRDGLLIDPQLYFLSLVDGTSPAEYVRVLQQLGPLLYKYGIGQQNDSGGTPRGRLFLPHAGCRNCAPRPGEERFGVRQDPAAWEHAIDINDRGLAWVWVDRGGPEYVPLDIVQPVPIPQPTPTPQPTSDLEQRVQRLERVLAAMVGAAQ